MPLPLQFIDVHRYSAVFTTPCDKPILVWRNNEHPRQDQLKDHIRDCQECQKINKENKVT